MPGPEDERGAAGGWHQRNIHNAKVEVVAMPVKILDRAFRCQNRQNGDTKLTSTGMTTPQLAKFI